MKLLFIDETSDAFNKHYLGVCGALIDASKYGEIKRDYVSKMAEYGWDLSVEFKGTTIFSQSQGCQSIPVEKRVELAKDIIGMNCSTSNARIKFCYVYSTSGSDAKNYLSLVNVVTSQLLQSGNTKKGGKDIISICCDQRTDVKPEDLRQVISPILEKKKLILFEDVVQMKSSTMTMGLCYADMVAYLMARIDNISHRGHGEIDPIKNLGSGQFKKLLSSTEIVGLIKSLSRVPILGTVDIDRNGAIQLKDAVKRKKAN